ncbi:zinc finger domain-containing protein [Kitasatospora sp. NPDC001683]
MANSATAVPKPATHSPTPPPSRARLERLLEAVERRRLTPVEVADLRRGVEHLTVCLAGAGAQLRQSILDAERVEEEHAAELRVLRTPGLGVECRRCGAAVGVWCRPVDGEVARTLHVARLVDAGVLS